MIGHYLQTAFRHFARFRYSTIANVLCLSFGITCFFCAYSVFAYFASSESAFSKANQIYIVKTDMIRKFQSPVSVAGMPYVMTKYLKEELPELRDVSFATNLLGMSPKKIIVDGKDYDGLRMMAADNAFLQMFDIGMINGDRNTALSSPQDALLSKSLAIKLFGTTDVIGKTFSFDNGVNAVIAGITDALPLPTHLNMLGTQGADGKHYLDLILSWRLYQQLLSHEYSSTTQNFTPTTNVLELNSWPYTNAYMLIPRHGLTTDELNRRLKTILQRSTQGQPVEYNGEKTTYQVSAVPVNRALSIFADSTSTLLDMPLTTLLVTMGTVILVVATLNYVNLYTTQLIACRREIGTQRLLGATRLQIILQFIIETTIVSVAAMLLALLFFQPMKAVIAQFSFVEFSIDWLIGWRFGLCMLGTVALVTLLSTIYPMVTIARIAPLDSMQIRSGDSPNTLTQSLVAAQFAIAGAMLVLLVVIQQQRTELERLAVGNLNDPVVVIGNNLHRAGVNYQTFVNQLSRYPQIKEIAIADGGLWGTGFSFEHDSVSADLIASTTQYQVDTRYVSSGLFGLMNIRSLAGSAFNYRRDEDHQQPTTNAAGSGESPPIKDVIVDQNFVGLLGKKSPGEIIGMELHGHGNLPQQLRIIGVVENSYQGINGTHNRATIFMQGLRDGLPVVKLSPTDTAGGLKAIDEVWKQLVPNEPINRQLAKDRYALQGAGGMLMFFTLVLSFFIVLAVAIAIMGMVGMALHALTRRTREISIRKSLGASSIDIYKMLLRFFATPVFITTIIMAWPLGWLASRSFLSLFPYRITIGPWPFILSLLITLIIVLLAISAQSLRAARRKPAEVLRYE